MLYPTINDLTKGKFNRYELSLATARCARIVTDEYVKQREEAERAQEKSLTGSKETDKPINAKISKELSDEKAVKVAIKRIYEGDYVIVRRPEGYVAESAEEEIVEEEPIDLKKIFAEADDAEDADEIGENE